MNAKYLIIEAIKLRMKQIARKVSLILVLGALLFVSTGCELSPVPDGERGDDWTVIVQEWGQIPDGWDENQPLVDFNGSIISEETLYINQNTLFAMPHPGDTNEDDILDNENRAKIIVTNGDCLTVKINATSSGNPQAFVKVVVQKRISRLWVITVGEFQAQSGQYIDETVCKN